MNILKTNIALLTFSLISSYGYGQDLHIRGITVKTETVSTYELTAENSWRIYLKMTYGGSSIEQTDQIKKLNGGEIVSVELICSDYPKGSSFQNLTAKRIETLKKMNPQLFNNPKINWIMIRQTDCQNLESAKLLYHGLVITFISQQRIKINKEIKEINDLLEKQKNQNKNARCIY